MKRLFLLTVFAVLTVACGSPKKLTGEPTREKARNLEGERVTVETVALQGIEMSESLSDDGTEIIRRPFKWYAGQGVADNRQMAVELAQREAYATISRVFNNTVLDDAERGNLANDGKVLQALTSHWKQVSASISRSCEPFGEAVIEYNPMTGMYSVTAKVAIRGDKFFELLDTAGEFEPEDLSADEVEQFKAVNKSIMEAARGNN